MSALHNAPDAHWSTRGACVGRAAKWSPVRPPRTGPDNIRRRRVYDAAVEAAKAGCRTCPVFDLCEKWALSVEDDKRSDTIVAAMTGEERYAAREAAEADRAAGQVLTARQRAVLRHRRAGLNNIHIAALMGVAKLAVEKDVAALRAAGHDLDHLKPPTTRGACGTDVGRKAHTLNGERRCHKCTGTGADAEEAAA